MLKVDRRRLLQTARETGWDLRGHIERVYDVLRFRNGRFPRLIARPGEQRPAIQQSLIDWNADLGARDRMDWKGFLSRHQTILQPLTALPRLGRLDERGIDTVCTVVQKLEGFKKTLGRKLVFGSKAAHLHFPGIAPVMSSEVARGLAIIEKRYARELDGALPSPDRRFRFQNAQACVQSYRNYVSFGNVLMRDIDSRTFLGPRSHASYDLHAKIFEWWVVAFAD